MFEVFYSNINYSNQFIKYKYHSEIKNLLKNTASYAKTKPAPTETPKPEPKPEPAPTETPKPEPAPTETPEEPGNTPVSDWVKNSRKLVPFKEAKNIELRLRKRFKQL